MAENRRRINIIRFCFCVCQLLNMVGYISDCMGIKGVFSFVSKSYILLNIIPFALHFLDSKKLGKEVFFLILMGASAILSFLLHGDGISVYDFALTLCAYLSLPMYFVYLETLPFDEMIYKVVKLSVVVTAVFFCYRFLVNPQYSLRDDLTLGFFNSNYLSILLIQNMSLLLVLKSLEPVGPMYFIYWILFFFEGYMVYETHSRTAFMCVLVMLVLPFKPKKSISKLATNLAILLPIIFVLLLTYFAENGFLSDWEFLEKPLLSGREKMFNTAINVLFAKYPVFGFFEAFHLGNAHNAFVSVLTSVGGFGFIFFFGFYYNAIHRLRQKLNGNPTRYLAYLGILLLFLEGCAEASVLLSGSMYAAATSPLLLFIKYGEPAEEPKKEESIL